MAILNVNLMSKTLMRTVNVKVILPIDKMVFPGMPVREDKPFKTLYLLHGVFGDNNDWIKGTRIALWAEENNLAVVMPSGENQFYVDQTCPGFQFGDFIGKELVEITRKMFPLSTKREDTYIGGLSMGGYGSLANGIKNCETFGHIVALSSALVTDKAADTTYDFPFMLENRHYFERCFGDASKVMKSRMHIQNLVKETLEAGKKLPQIFMACGTEDSLISNNNEFVAYLQEQKVDVTYITGPGNHNWEFWDTYIKKGLEWLPLEHTDMGINSGNVGQA